MSYGRKNVGEFSSLPNDPIGGMIGSAQFNQWRAHFGDMDGSGAGVTTSPALPEPMTFHLVLAAPLALSSRRRVLGTVDSESGDT